MKKNLHSVFETINDNAKIYKNFIRVQLGTLCASHWRDAFRRVHNTGAGGCSEAGGSQ